jgi:hypothetical protein
MIFYRHWFEKIRLILYLNLGISYIFEDKTEEGDKKPFYFVSVSSKNDTVIKINLEKIERKNCYFIIGRIYQKTLSYYNLRINTTDDTIDILNKTSGVNFIFSKLPYFSDDNERVKLYLINTFINYIKKRHSNKGKCDDIVSK